MFYHFPYIILLLFVIIFALQKIRKKITCHIYIFCTTSFCQKMEEIEIKNALFQLFQFKLYFIISQVCILSLNLFCNIYLNISDIKANNYIILHSYFLIV